MFIGYSHYIVEVLQFQAKHFLFSGEFMIQNPQSPSEAMARKGRGVAAPLPKRRRRRNFFDTASSIFMIR